MFANLFRKSSLSIGAGIAGAGRGRPNALATAALRDFVCASARAHDDSFAHFRLRDTASCADTVRRLLLPPPQDGSADGSEHIDIGLVHGAVAWELAWRHGMDAAAASAQSPTGPGLRILAAACALPGALLVRRDAEFRSAIALRGKLLLGYRGSGARVCGAWMADGMRISANERNVQREDLPDDEFAEFMVAQGRASAAYVEVPNGEDEAAWTRPSLFNRLTSTSDLTQLLVPYSITEMLKAHPMVLRPMSISAAAAGVASSAAPGSSASSSSSAQLPLPPRLPTVGAWMFLVARPGLDDAVAYRVARALHLAQTGGEAAAADADGASSGSSAGSGLGSMFSSAPTSNKVPPIAREMTARNTLAAAPHATLIHAGVRGLLSELKML
jgi:hypothetical protein